MDYYHIHIHFHYGELERELQRKPFTTYIKMFKVAELFFSHEESFGGNVETATIIQYHNVLWGQIKSD